MNEQKKNSITLIGAIGLGTGVMISAGIFALLGQIAELSNQWIFLIFLVGAVVTGFSAYSYIKFSQNYPSAGGIGMYLVKAYGKGVFSSVGALMMILSMVINQSLVAKTFGSYTMQIFNGSSDTWVISVLGVGLLIFALIINLLRNSFIQTFTSIMSVIKILGLVLFAAGGLFAARFALKLPEVSEAAESLSFAHYIAATALAVIAFKGFTTITNNGDEIIKPKVNVGRAIMFSIIISLVVYIVVTFGVTANLSVSEIIASKDYALAEAARPVFSGLGLWFTVILAILATITGIIASVFAVSRLIAMLANMQMIPHKKISENIKTQQQTIFYTVGLAIVLTILFDLTRIASLGVFLYLVMDMMIHYGLVVKMKDEIKVNRWIVWSAFILDFVILLGFLYIKISTDLLVVIVAAAIIIALFIIQKLFFKLKEKTVT
ncbi:amino acid permease [Tenericutes bacterium MZ-XQ]|nr:amino acid permease [Tenericutes bacterium MZ-XQ]